MRGDAGTALLENEMSVGDVDLALSPTRNEARDYYLVFRSLVRKSRTVEATFTVSLI